MNKFRHNAQFVIFHIGEIGMMGNIPKSLQDAIRANLLIPVVGAGVSMSIKDKEGNQAFPSWKGLLEAAAQKLTEELKEDYATLVKVYLGMNDYQQAADSAYKGLKGENWFKFFDSQFNKNSDYFDNNSAALPKAIWKLSSKIITLNYDRIMEWGYGNNSQIKSLDNNSKAELANFQRQEYDKPMVWHLHGKIDDQSELILTSQSYKKLYDNNDGDYKAALETLRNLNLTYSFLFIGCSLDDAEILNEINRQQELFSGNSKQHFALVHKNQEKDIQAKLKDTNIHLITFENFGNPLVELVESLSQYSMDKKQVSVSAKPEIKKNEVAAIQPISKIALLSANPLNSPQDYKKIITKIKKINCEIDHFNLSIDNLNSLDGYSHLIILSQISNNRILIEDDYFCSKKISLSEFESNVNDPNVNGIYVFTNNLPNDKSTENLMLPILFLADIEKSKVENIAYTIFKKNNLQNIENLKIINELKFSVPILSSTSNNKINKFKNETPLPSSIDKKTTNSFVGRINDIENICRKLLILEDEGGFLTVKGSGGIGKTTIVKKLTIALAERGLFQGGITFVDCEFIVDYSQFQFQVANAFNLEQADDVRQHLHDHFDNKKRLIILDNFETLLHINDSEEIKDFLKFICDYSTVIVTSREILQLEGEIIHVIRQLTTDEAVDIFFVGSDMRKEDLDENDMRILRRDILENLLDRNPLAIKLIKSNIPAKKCLSTLKRELEEDLFNRHYSKISHLSLVNKSYEKSMEMRYNL